MRGDGTAAQAKNTVVPLLNDHVFQYPSQSLIVLTPSKQVPLNSDRDQIVAVVPRHTEYKRNFIGEDLRQGPSSNSCFFFFFF